MGKWSAVRPTIRAVSVSGWSDDPPQQNGLGVVLSYVFMKILEGRPRSYDHRIDRLSAGRTRQIRERVAVVVAPESKVLEIGCGTGELAGELARSGCTVDGFDLSAAMIAVAQEKAEAAGLRGSLHVWRMGMHVMDSLPDSAYAVVVSVLVFSELTDDERRFALDHAVRTLKPNGRLVIADEVTPRSVARRAIHAVLRVPLVTATYLITRSSTHPIKDLLGELCRAGLTIEKEERSQGDSLAIVIARRATERAAS